MSDLGNRLRAYRDQLGFSLRRVEKEVGITDSRLRRIERGETENLSVGDLKKLAKLYNIPVVDFYIDIGYLESSDLSEYQQAFRGVSMLDDEEKQYIQNLIDLLNRKKVQS